MKTLFARLSLFDKGPLKPLDKNQSCAQFLKLARKKFGKPYRITREKDWNIYKFLLTFDAVTIVISKNGLIPPDTIGTNF